MAASPRNRRRMRRPMSLRTARLTGRLESRPSDTSPRVGVGDSLRWQALAAAEFAAVDQLGPLAKAVLDYAPREMTAAAICSEYRKRKSPWHPKWNPDCRLDWKDPKVDAAFAEFLRAEYKRRTGIDPAETALMGSHADRAPRI